MKKALLVVSFGTSVPRARREIEAVEQALAAQAPDRTFFRAYTSPTIRRLLAQRGEQIFDLNSALENLAVQGYEDVAVAVTHLLYGIEYDKIKEQTAAFSKRFPVCGLVRRCLRTAAACVRWPAVCCRNCLRPARDWYGWATGPSILPTWSTPHCRPRCGWQAAAMPMWER